MLIAARVSAWGDDHGAVATLFSFRLRPSGLRHRWMHDPRCAWRLPTHVVVVLLLSLLGAPTGHADPAASARPSVLRWLSWCPHSQLLGKYGVNRVSVTGADANNPDFAVAPSPEWRAFGAAGISFSYAPITSTPFTKRIRFQSEFLVNNRGAELLIDGVRVGSNTYRYLESPFVARLELLPRTWPMRLHPMLGMGLNVRLSATVTDRDGASAAIPDTNLFDLVVLAGVGTEAVAIDRWVFSGEVRYQRGLIPIGDADDFDDLRTTTWSILIGVGYRFSAHGSNFGRSSVPDAE